MEKEFTLGRMVVDMMVSIYMIRSTDWVPTLGLMGESIAADLSGRYEGNWANGKQHGKGRYVLPDGSVRSGLWEDGKRLKWDDEHH
jgi:hypothetical protein